MRIRMPVFLRSHPWLFPFILALVVFLPTVTHDFVGLDDPLLVYDNPAVTTLSTAGIAHVFSSYDPELYIPLTFLSYQFEHAVSGGAPWLFHLTNALLHAGSVLLLFWILRRITGSSVAALVASTLFAIHPVQVEAVAWVTARKDLLSGFLFLAALALYLRWLEEQSVFRWLSVGTFLLALLAKVTVLGLPFILLLVDWWRRELSWQRVREKWPYFFLSIIFGIVAFFGKVGYTGILSPWEQLLLACKSVVFSLKMLLLPVGLTVFYEQHAPMTVSSPAFFIPLILCVALGVMAIFLARRSRTFAFGAGIFLIFFVPAFATFARKNRVFFASDRYVYLASIGLFLIVGSVVARVWQRQSVRPFLALLGVIVVAALVLLSLRQSRTWQNSYALYQRAIAIDPQSAVAYNNLGSSLWKQGDEEGAVAAYEQAMAINPLYSFPPFNLGTIARDRGDDVRAMEMFRQAVTAVEAAHGPFFLEDLAPYYMYAELLENRGRVEEALEQYDAAIARAPDLAEPYYNKGVFLQKHGRAREAMFAFEEAVTHHKPYLAAQYHLAAVYAELGHADKAVEQLEAVVAVDPGYEDAARHLQNLRQVVN